MKQALLFFPFLLVACGADSFVSALEGGASDAVGEADADGGDAADVEASILDAPACTIGTQACEDVLDAFCARMKACCNGTCTYSWQNTGGTECRNYLGTAYLGPKGCAEVKQAANTKCETACVSDIQSASCTAIKGAPWPGELPSACPAFWP